MSLMHLILFSNVFLLYITDRAFFLLLQCLFAFDFTYAKYFSLIRILHEARLHQSTIWKVQIKCSARCFFYRYAYISMGREIPIVPHNSPTLMSYKALLSKHIEIIKSTSFSYMVPYLQLVLSLNPCKSAAGARAASFAHYGRVRRVRV